MSPSSTRNVSNKYGPDYVLLYLANRNVALFISVFRQQFLSNASGGSFDNADQKFLCCQTSDGDQIANGQGGH